MRNVNPDGAAPRRLGRILYVLAFALGVAELGIASRAGEWLNYSQLGQLATFYTVSLLIGVTIAPAIRSPRVATVVGVLLSALPIIGIGYAVATLPSDEIFSVVLVLWSLSGAGSGIVDNTQSSSAVHHSTRGREDSVNMLAIRHMGTLGASLLSLVLVGRGIDASFQYMFLGAVLLVPAVLGRWMPGAAPRTTPAAEAAGAHANYQSVWMLPVMGFFAAAGVLPVSLTWTWAEPVMRELKADASLASLTLTIFVIAQGAACVVYFLRSRKHDGRRLVVGGLWIAALGVVLLGVSLIQARTPFLAADQGRYVAMAGMALFGWGVAPLPMVVMNRVGRLRLRMGTRLRIALAVIVQCLIVAGANYAFGNLAGLFTGFGAYVAAATICVGALLLCLRLLATQKRASA